jgi:hypothetical protein
MVSNADITVVKTIRTKAGRMLYRTLGKLYVSTDDHISCDVRAGANLRTLAQLYLSTHKDHCAHPSILS